MTITGHDGPFHQEPDLAARIKAAPAEDDVRFRGEHLSIHTIDGVAYAVLREEWFSPAASTWVQHSSAAAASSWAHQPRQPLIPAEPNGRNP